MKRKILALFFGILWSLLLVPSVFAMDTDVDPSIRIYDYADLLTDEEEEALSETARELSEKWSVDLVTVTIDDDEGLTSMEYADDFFDYNGFSTTGVLMLINMDEREVWFFHCRLLHPDLQRPPDRSHGTGLLKRPFRRRL